MQCSACGTQLPQEAAYCPNCGSATPYHFASSGTSPSDMTIVPSSNPTHPNTPPPPPLVPPPPRQRRLSALNSALLIILALVIITAGSIFYFRAGSLFGQTPQLAPTATPTQQATPIPTPTTPAQQATLSPTPPAQQITPTPAAQTPQDLYTQITQTPPALDDPLSVNDANHWTEDATADGGCAFSGGAYHARAQQKNMTTLCMAQATNYGDLAYQIQMTIVTGDLGGIVFRTDLSQSKYYSFFIDRSGTYTLITSVDNTGTHDRVLDNGPSPFIKTDLNQPNLLAIIARGSTISLYINQHFITSANDSTYHAGQIGVFGGSSSQAPANVVFQHLQVWKTP